MGDEEEGELLGDVWVVGGWKGKGRERKTRGNIKSQMSRASSC